MELNENINILKNIFNMNINQINIIITKIEKIDINPILDILYCYLDKPDMIFNIINNKSKHELIFISYLININILTYSQCLELFDMNELKIRLIFNVANQLLLNNKLEKIYYIFELFKSMNGNVLLNFSTIFTRLKGPFNFIEIYNICVNISYANINIFGFS